VWLKRGGAAPGAPWREREYKMESVLKRLARPESQEERWVQVLGVAGDALQGESIWDVFPGPNAFGPGLFCFRASGDGGTSKSDGRCEQRALQNF
jgi:hypothetical protein